MNHSVKYGNMALKKILLSLVCVTLLANSSQNDDKIEMSLKNAIENDLSNNLMRASFEYLNYPDFMSAINYFNLSESKKNALKMANVKESFYGKQIQEYYHPIRLVTHGEVYKS